MPEKPTPPEQDFGGTSPDNKPVPPDNQEKPPKKWFKGVRIRIYKNKKREQRQASGADETPPPKIPEPIEAFYAREHRESQDAPQYRRPLKRVSPVEEAGRQDASKLKNYKKIRAGFVAGLLLGLVIGLTPNKYRQKKPRAGGSLNPEISQLLENHELRRFTHFDYIPQIRREVPGGEFSAVEKARRMDARTVPGLTIFHDIGRDFVYVPAGRTISQIKKELSRYPQYAYLKEQKTALKSFNIQVPKNKSARGKLRPPRDQFIPIPLPETTRRITNSDFAYYGLRGIKEMAADSHYGPEMKKMLEIVSYPELLSTIFAVARQEGGGRPLGQYVWQRYEPKYKAFSYSIFHVLNHGPGKKARQQLNLTPGQLTHPENAVRVFLGFIMEKKREMRIKYADILPVTDNIISFTKFYNGTNWRKNAPHYPDHILRFHKQAAEFLSSQNQATLKEQGELAMREYQNDRTKRQVGSAKSNTAQAQVPGPSAQSGAPGRPADRRKS